MNQTDMGTGSAISELVGVWGRNKINPEIEYHRDRQASFEKARQEASHKWKTSLTPYDDEHLTSDHNFTYDPGHLASTAASANPGKYSYETKSTPSTGDSFLKSTTPRFTDSDLARLKAVACDGVPPGNPRITHHGADYSNYWGKAMELYKYQSIYIFGGEKDQQPRYRHFETGLAVLGVNYYDLNDEMEKLFTLAERTERRETPYQLGDIVINDADTDSERDNIVFPERKSINFILSPQITLKTPSQKLIKKECGANTSEYKDGGKVLDALRKGRDGIKSGILALYQDHRLSQYHLDMYQTLHLQHLIETHINVKGCIMSKREAVSFSEGVRSFIKDPEFSLANKPDVQSAMTKTTTMASRFVRSHLAVCSDTACNALRTLVVQLHDHSTERARPLGFNGIIYQGFLRKHPTLPYVTFCPDCNNSLKEWESETSFHQALDGLAGPLFSPPPTPFNQTNLNYPNIDFEPAPEVSFDFERDIVAMNILIRHTDRDGMCSKGKGDKD